MGRPAAQVGGMHVCPMVTGTVPHVGGPILPPGIPTVIIGGMPAVVQGNFCTCVGPPDVITMGSLGVFIGGAGAVRVLEPTSHGGQVTVGFPTVIVGDINAAAAASIFPGQQNFGNCGVQSSEQIIHQASGTAINENTILQVAINNGWAGNSANPLSRGGTSAAGRQQILANYGVSSRVVNTSPQAISTALVNRQGIIVNADAGVLWNNPAFIGGGHAVTITDGDWDANGNLTHVYVNDTGTGQQGQRMPVNNLMNAANARTGGSQLNVTNGPVWTQVW